MRVYRFAVFVIVCLAAATIVDAQVNRAMISGTVTDPSGAPIPGVTITVTGESGLTQTAVTGGSGQYTLPSLPVGTYTAKFEIQGFKTSVRNGLTLQVAQTLRLDTQLEVGELAETVTVPGFEIIQRDSPDVGTTVSREYLTSLPLSMGGGRYPETFAYKMTPGVEGDTWTSRINGSPAFSKEVLLEGASVTTYLAGHFGESVCPWRRCRNSRSRRAVSRPSSAAPPAACSTS